MSFFSKNLGSVRRMCLRMWRELAGLAGESGLMNATRAKFELKMTVWLYEDGKKTASRMFVRKVSTDLEEKPTKRRRISAWDRLLDD